MPYQRLRLYLQNSAAAVSPAFSPSGVGFSWFDTSQAIRKAAGLTRGSTAITTQGITITATNSSTWLAAQFVSEPLGLTAPSILGSGLYRCSTNEHSTTSPQRLTTLVVRAHFVSNDGATVRTPSGSQPDSGEMPPIFYSGPYVDSTSLQTEGKSAPVTPSIVGGVPQWHPSAANYADYARYPTVTTTDRLVLSIGFTANGGSNRTPALEYGENNATPLDLANPNAAGHPFFDLYVFLEEGQAQDSMIYQRPKHPTHRRERLVFTPTPDIPFLGEESFE